MKSLAKKNLDELEQVLNSLDGDEHVLKDQLVKLKSRLTYIKQKQLQVQQEWVKRKLQQAINQPSKNWIAYLEASKNYNDFTFRERRQFLLKETGLVLSAESILTHTNQPSITIRLDENTKTALPEIATLLNNLVLPFLIPFTDAQNRSGKLLKINKPTTGHDYQSKHYRVQEDGKVLLHDTRDNSGWPEREFNSLETALVFQQEYYSHDTTSS